MQITVHSRGSRVNELCIPDKRACQVHDICLPMSMPNGRPAQQFSMHFGFRVQSTLPAWTRLLVLTNTQRSPTIGPRQIYRARQSPVDVTGSLTVHITVHVTVHVTVHLRICVTAQFIMVQSEMNRSREVRVLQFKYRSTQNNRSHRNWRCPHK